MTTSPRPFGFRLLVFFLGLAAVASAAPVKFDIPAQPASNALDLFVRQSGTEVMFNQAALAKLRSPEVRGEMEPAAALTQLLAGTGFTHHRNGGSKFMVAAIAPARPGSIEGSVREEKSGRPVVGAKVAITGTDKFVLTDKRGRFAFTEAPTGDQELLITAEGMQNTKVTDVAVKPGHRHSLSAIGIPVRQEGTLNLDPFIVSAKKNDGVLELDPYAVSGRKEKPFSGASIDLQRTKEDVLPFQVFTGEEVLRSGASNLSEFFRTRLPQNFNTSIPEEDAIAGTMSVENSGLRFAAGELNLANGAGPYSGALGQSAKELVILVDGRRLPTRGGTESGSFQGDFRSIPASSIERVEILSSAGSAIYGTGATGGAINIITKQNFRGGDVSLRYETPLDTVAPRKAFDLYYVWPLTPRLSIRLGYSFADSVPVELKERADVTVDRYRRLLTERAPDRLASGRFNNPWGATTNIRILDNTTFNTIAITSVPGGPGIPDASKFKLGAYNLESHDGYGYTLGYGKNSLLGPKRSTSNYLAELELVLHGDWRLTAGYHRADNEYRGKSSTLLFSFMRPTSPTNPFGNWLAVSWYDPRLDRPEFISRGSTKNEQVVLTLRGTYKNWRTILDASASRDLSFGKEVLFDDLIGPFNPTIGPGANVRTAVDTGVYNPLVDMRTVSPAASSVYEQYNQRRFESFTKYNSAQLAAKTSGSVFPAPGGDIQLTAGLEWLHNELKTTSATNHVVNSKTGAKIFEFVSDNRFSPFVNDSYSIYSELTAPIIGSSHNLRLTKRLDVFASGRVSRQTVAGFKVLSSNSTSDSTGIRTVNTAQSARYSTTPNAYAAGARWDLTEDLGIRLSQSIGFRPPNFSETTPSLPPAPGSVRNVNDTKTGQANYRLTSTMFIEGGNPELDPEGTSSTNIGILLRPRIFKGLHLAVDYVSNRRDTAISSIDVQTAVNLANNDAKFTSRVQRDGVGNITFVDARNINLREITSKTMGFTLEEVVENVWHGRVIITAVATRNISFKVQTSTTGQPVEQVRHPEATFATQFPIEWNANGQVRWEGHRWTIGWSTRYLDYVLVRAADVVAQGSTHIPSAFDHDFFIGLRVPKRGGSRFIGSIFGDLSVTCGIKNVFDRTPRFDARASNLGYYGADSIYGRSFWIQLNKSL